jgi:hypothetical protein
MAARKPKIGFGPVDDVLFDIIQKALASASKKKSTQGRRVVNKLIDRGGMISKDNSEVIFKSRYPKKGPNSKYAKDYPAESREARQKAAANAKPRLDAKKAAGKKASQARVEEAAAQRAANNARIIKEQDRTLRMTRLGDAAAEKGSKTRGGKEIPMGKKKAAAADRQGRMAGAQRKKGNASKKAKAAELDAAIKSAKGGAEKRAAMQRRRKFRDETGF